MTLPTYSTGTVSIANGGTTVTGSGTIWSGTNAKEGDYFVRSDGFALITEVTDTTHLKITPWPGATVSGGAYSIAQNYAGRILGVAAAQDVGTMLGALKTEGFFFFVAPADTVPDPSLGADGQYAFQPTTGKTWAKVAGVWTYLGIYKGFNFTGAYNGATTYSVGDVMTDAGTSYVWINPTPGSGHAAPNATYWQVVASKGDTGATGATGAGYGGTSTTSLVIGAGSKAFTTQAGLAYTNGARVRASSAANTANWMEGLATYSGTTLTINVDKTGGSGTHADWNLNVVGEPGAGDLLSTNSLLDVASIPAARRNLNVSNKRVPIAAGQAFKVFSDSIGVGLGASTATKFGWNYLLTNRLGLTHNNYSTSGLASNFATKQAFANLAIYNRRSDALAWMAYHNDVYRGGAAAATLAKIQGELRSFLANAFLTSAVPISDSSVTKAGTWTLGALINEKAVSLGGSLRYSTTLNDTLSWTFAGDSLVVGLFNTDGTSGYRYGTCTIAVDGATSGNGFATFSGDSLSDGISDGAYDNKITHNAVVLTGLGTGSHTVVLKVTGTLGPVYVDYFGTLAAPSSCAPVLVAESSRPNAAGYSLGGGVWSAAAFDAADAAVRSVVNEFYNYPAALVKTGDWLNYTTGISGDNEHPNDLGHSQIAAAFNEAMLPARIPFVGATCLAMSADQSITNAAYNQVLFATENFDDYNLHSTSSNTSRITFDAAGWSRFEGHIGFASNSTGIREAFIFKNGSPLRMVATSPALSGDNTVCPFTTVIQHAPGDYFELAAIQSSGGALNVVAAQTMLIVTPIR